MAEQSYYPMIEIRGTPYEMGESHGRQMKKQIEGMIAAFREIVGEDAYDASWDDLRKTCAYCEQNVPELIEEIRGIADGAKIDFRDAFRVNAHVELIKWKNHVWDVQNKTHGSECSSHAIITDSDVLLGWNGDDLDRWLNLGMVVCGSPSGAEPFIYWSTAGSVGRPGMNRHLAFGANTLPIKRWRAEGVLYFMFSRLVLRCTSAEEAIPLFKKFHSCCGMNYLIADATGAILSIEAHPEGFACIRPKDLGSGNYLLHTNQYLHPELKDPSISCPRLEAARRLYRENPPRNAGDVRKIQSDHTGGICVHRENAQTVVSFVAEIRAGRIHIIHGSPCTGLPQTFHLNAQAEE